MDYLINKNSENNDRYASLQLQESENSLDSKLSLTKQPKKDIFNNTKKTMK